MNHKSKSFFFHYNKPASRSAGKPQITVHTGGKCIIVDNVECNVSTKGRVRKTQPMFVVCGKGNVVIKDNVAVIE